MATIKRTGNEFLQKLASLILDEAGLVGTGQFVKEKQPKVLQFNQPEKVESSWDLQIRREPTADDTLINLCRDAINQSVKTTHPNFYNQLYGGVEQYGVGGSWLTDALNTSAATWEINPIFGIMEKYLIQYCCSLMGYTSSDGIFAPGGSMANLYAMVLARHRAFPDIKKKGLALCPNLVMFASEDSHYSFVKGAIWLGMGSESVIKVKTDAQGKMIPSALQEAIVQAKKDGKVPYMIAATCGTTVLGAYDPLPEIGQICKEHNIWFHVDGAFGASVLLSKKYAHLCNGINESDSVTWDLHKITCVPFQCTLILTKHKGLLQEAHSLNAEYLFQSDKYYDASYDFGDKSIQCGRKVDSFKLWLSLKARGGNEMERLVDNLFEKANYLTKKLESTPGFEIVLPKFESSNICFWYTPPAMRNCKRVEAQTLHKVAPALKKKMMEAGTLMINYNPLTSKGLPNFFRLVLSCTPEPTFEDLDFVVDEIQRLGKDLKL